MDQRPDKQSFTKNEWRIIQSLKTPYRVQRYFSAMPYNWEREGGTLRSFREVLKHNEAHCLEAAVGAAVILEQHGYPPLLMDIESVDLLDHVTFVFQHNGLWGSIGRSRDIGLHGRRPVFCRLRDLAWSYFDTYIDFTGRITGYGLANLYDLGKYDWRFSARNLWKVEEYLRVIPHRSIRSSDRRYEQWHNRYKQFKKKHPNAAPDYYNNRHQWML